MTKTLSITQARAQLPTLVDKAHRLLDETVITVNGSPVAVLMSVQEFESWKETNEILADKKLMKDIREAEKEIAEGKGIPWEDVEKELFTD